MKVQDLGLVDTLAPSIALQAMVETVYPAAKAMAPVCSHLLAMILNLFTGVPNSLFTERTILMFLHTWGAEVVNGREQRERTLQT